MNVSFSLAIQIIKTSHWTNMFCHSLTNGENLEMNAKYFITHHFTLNKYPGIPISFLN